MNLIRLMDVHVHVLVLVKYFKYHVDQKAKPTKYFTWIALLCKKFSLSIKDILK